MIEKGRKNSQILVQPENNKRTLAGVVATANKFQTMQIAVLLHNDSVRIFCSDTGNFYDNRSQCVIIPL